MRENNYARYELAGVVVIDADWTGEKIHEISVVANEKTAPITGMWQVSGRSDITDFEEIVAMDVDYISNWSLKRDLEIILKTIQVVLHSDGAR
jgi:lipopolysaccharide/colanic/teichoic acid biosynthesis glycosyltransferase